MKRISLWLWTIAVIATGALTATTTFASEADIPLPDLTQVSFNTLGMTLAGTTLLHLGLVVCLFGLGFGLLQYSQVKALPVHPKMKAVSDTIWETCKTYLFQQGKFLAVLWVLIGACMSYYFVGLQHKSFGNLVIVLSASILGILGSYGVAWFGIRINTRPTPARRSRPSRAMLVATLAIPMRSGMSVGLLLVSVELFFMICILSFLPREIAGACFIGFAIGESLGASALRICGGIFTKIADIGSDLMKIVFNLPEDDPKNPGVIADCTGDNAGDSVGPTADGFETYGVTGVALIAFLALALETDPDVRHADRLDLRHAHPDDPHLAGLLLHQRQHRARRVTATSADFDAEKPLTILVWITSLISIGVTFARQLPAARPSRAHGALWWVLSIIITCGTLAGALIPEFTKIFTSTNSRHVQEVVTASKQGGASLNILSGFVAGNFSAFWEGLLILILMVVSYVAAQHPDHDVADAASIAFAAPIFAFGLVAFGFLGMGPVTIAVDSFGPVSDNAQSVYELSQIESGRTTTRRRSSSTSASMPTSRTPSSSSRRTTARATRSRPRPSRC